VNPEKLETTAPIFHKKFFFGVKNRNGTRTNLFKKRFSLYLEIWQSF